MRSTLNIVDDWAVNYRWASEQDGEVLEKLVYAHVEGLLKLAKEHSHDWNDSSPTFADFSKTPTKIAAALAELRQRSNDLDAIIWNEGRKKKNKWARKGKIRY